MASDEPDEQPKPDRESKPRKEPKYAAAVCYKVRKGKAEFLLVRTEGKRTRWIFPKGRVKKEEKNGLWKAAEREALEEAGVSGRMERKPLTRFRYHGQRIDAFLMKFKAAHDIAEQNRQPTWFRRKKALAALAENRGEESTSELSTVLLKAWHAVSPSARKQIFVSYSHRDEKWLERLKVVLKPLEQRTKVTVWADTGIRPGQKWKEEIAKALDVTKIAVLLVSPDYLASQFIKENELPDLLRSAKKQGLVIMWVALRPSAYEHMKIEKYQAVNNPKRPLARDSNRARIDKELNEIRLKIEAELDSGPD